MKVRATQLSATLQFVEQMEKHTIHRVMLRHKEFEFIILEIVSLITSLTSKAIKDLTSYLNYFLYLSQYKRGSMCNLIATRCKNATCIEPFLPPDSCCKVCVKLSPDVYTYSHT